METFIDRAFVLDSDPNNLFYPGDWIIPMVVGYAPDPPRMSYSENRDFAILEVSLSEKQINPNNMREPIDWHIVLTTENEKPIITDGGKQIVISQ